MWPDLSEFTIGSCSESMLVSCFKTVSSTEPPVLKDVIWPEFVEKLSSHIELADKTKAPAISPAEWPKGISRSGTKVLRIHFAALDLDKITDDTLESVLKTLEPYQYLLHTTHSHAASREISGQHCLRVYLPLTRPIELSEWSRFWQSLNAFVGGVLDPACKDAGRVYFVPSAPSGTREQNYARENIGQILDVERLLSKKSAHKGGGQGISQTALVSLAYSLLSKPDVPRKALGAQILKVAQGEVFAENGERDVTLFKICALLAERWPKANPEQVAALFEPSLAKMQAISADAPTTQDVIDKFSRKLKDAPQIDLDSFREDILDAFGGKRDTPYSDEELDIFAEEAGIPRSRLNKRWIIRKGESCYLFLGGQYGNPVSISELVDAAQIDLAPAITAGVECFRFTDRGRKVLKKEKDLLQEYSTLARSVVADLSAQKSTYDWKTQTLTEAPCPLRDLEPTYSEAVDEYLRLLGGKSQGQLLDWVALVTKLDNPCAALFLYGAPGAGKSLLALGLTRLWTMGTPTQLKDVLGSFNDSLSACPLVVADEKIPCLAQKEGGSAELRNLIQEYSRPLRRKFQATATLKGALRLIVTANNRNALSWKESLNNHDIEAIRDRILSIEVGEDSAAFLRSLGEARNAFVLGDAIAKHALWLRDNRKVDSDSRFLVRGNNTVHADSLVANTKMGPHVFHWLTSYLLNPSRMDSQDNLLIRIHEGRLLVMARGLVENWETYVTNSDKRFATMNNISEALSSMSAPKRKQLYDSKKAKANYWQVETQYLTAWATEHGYDTEQLKKALLTDTVTNA